MVSEKHKVRILFVADTHNDLQYDDNALSVIKNEGYDCCILLGDHSHNDLKLILQYIPSHKIYGILGNHDTWGQYHRYGVKDIHCRGFLCNGVKIIGLSGSYKYKETDTYAMLTQQESVRLTSEFPNCDILVTHAKAMDLSCDKNNCSHDGLLGIATYIQRCSPTYHVHGHMHVNNTEIINNTISVGVYGAKVIEFHI